MSVRSSNGKDVSISDLNDQIVALKTDMSLITQTIAELGKAQGAALQTSASDKAAELRKQGEAALSDAHHSAVALAEKAETKVRDNPTTAVAVATGVGFVLGLALGRR